MVVKAPLPTGDAEMDEILQRKYKQSLLELERKQRAAMLETSDKLNTLVKVKEKTLLFVDNEHSKIYKALNPEKLAFQTARDREEEEEEEEIVISSLRNDEGKYLRAQLSETTMATTTTTMATATASNPFENEEEEEEEEEDTFDPMNIPDFGEEMEELKRKREIREKEEQARREELKRQFEEKNASNNKHWQRNWRSSTKSKRRRKKPRT